MELSQETTYVRRMGLHAESAAFFLLIFLYVWWFIDPVLVHHAMGIFRAYHTVCFKTGSAFLLEHLDRPGGVVEYISRFLSNAYLSAIAGALIMTTVAWGTAIATDHVTKIRRDSAFSFLRYGPPLLLLALYSRYEHPLNDTLSLLLALTTFVVYRQLAAKRVFAGLAFSMLCIAAIYYIAGGVWVVFLLLTSIDTLLVRRKAAACLLLTVCGIAIPLCLEWLIVRPSSTVARAGLAMAPMHMTWHYSILMFVLFSYYPSILGSSALLRGFIDRWRAKRGRRRKSTAPHPLQANERLRSMAGWLRMPGIRGVVALVACVCVARLCFQESGKLAIKLDYCCQQKLWAEALAAAAQLPGNVYNARSNRNIMLALCCTERLGDEMFRYPQTQGDTEYDLLDPKRDRHCHFQDSLTFLYLGQINLAEKSAYEAFTATGELPALLEHLALIHLVKGEISAAETHLGALRRQPFQARKADAWLERIANDPSLEDEPIVQQLRRSNNTRDDAVLVIDIEEMLSNLVTADPDNRAAFEFLMAHYLRHLHPDKVVAHLDALEGLGYTEVPRHFQEAIIVDANRRGQSTPKDDPRLNTETIERAEAFFRVLANARTREEARAGARALGLGDSYLMYYCFGESGL